ncbi:hypothetical protein ACE1B6_00725 [Aerosakkonemataceae cyanobacterium BLCC-F154]|uniref:Yip1 domain-containing protein n=1 Tax=Floridaenema fluviatile BLCC-F154 TaxID=3153640 RepID=A0ABV4Y787_9CYAN
MNLSAFDKFGELVWGALALQSEAFQQIITLPDGVFLALLIVFLAGLSRAIGQGIVLFLNRVQPLRYFLSLLLGAILFAFSYIFWVLSTWVVSSLIDRQYTSLISLASTLGLSYSPLILGIFVALPYLGVPISIILSIWSFFAYLIGLRIALNSDTWEAFWAGVLGWIVFEILQRTIGRPIAYLGKWLKTSVAGVRLVTDLKDVEEILQKKARQTTGKRSD